MKLMIGILLFAWLASGLLGAWRLHDMRVGTIARGPVTMAKYLSDEPPPQP